ncbi:MAG: CHRD domain-containing protein [Chloroflexota bacterium]|nr:CHRD domain-containing protein [Chloroflexota bacterium]
MKRLSIIAIAALMVAALAAPTVLSADNSRKFNASLNGYLEVPSISTAGRGTFTATVKGSTISYRLRYSGLGSEAVAAHIHFARPDVNGGVVAFLCGGGDKPVCPPAGGTVSGVIDAPDVIGPEDKGILKGEIAELIRAMRAGATYVNVHTHTYPSGEIRGNVSVNR